MRQQGRVVDAAWMEENMPDLHPEWQPEDNDQAANGAMKGMKGLMYKGKWLISPERQERTVRLFWVSALVFLIFYGRTTWRLLLVPGQGLTARLAWRDRRSCCTYKHDNQAPFVATVQEAAQSMLTSSLTETPP